LLLIDLSRSRFGARAARKAPVMSKPASAAGRQAGEGRQRATERSATRSDRSGPALSTAGQRPVTAVDQPFTAPAHAGPTQSASTPDIAVQPQPASAHRAVRRAARRAVIQRDGLGCSWVSDHGVRCGSQAWLEFDHREPAGKGGSSTSDNVRLLCRAHNGLSAEQHYGREHIARAIRRRRHRQTRENAASPDVSK
jgi:hypothetical protein